MEVKPVRFQGALKAGPHTVAVAEDAPLHEHVIAALRGVYDPEIPVNIYDLGLVYAIDIQDDQVARIAMTLTAPGCPVAGSLPGQVAEAVRGVRGIRDAQVQLVWDPPWSQARMSEAARLALDLL